MLNKIEVQASHSEGLQPQNALAFEVTVMRNTRYYFRELALNSLIISSKTYSYEGFQTLKLH